MKKTKHVFLLLSAVFLLTACGGSDGKKENQKVLIPQRMFSLMSIDLSHETTYNPQNVANVIRNENPAIVALQGVDYKTTRSGNKDEVTELAYLSDRCGLFAPSFEVDNGQTGVGLLVNGLFEGTQRTQLSADIAALEMNYTLSSGDKIKVVSVKLPTVNPSQIVLLAQKYGGDSQNTIIALSVTDEVTPEWLGAVDASFSRLCKNIPTTGKTAYLLYPRSQFWGISQGEILSPITGLKNRPLLSSIGIMQ